MEQLACKPRASGAAHAFPWWSREVITNSQFSHGAQVNAVGDTDKGAPRERAIQPKINNASDVGLPL